MAETPQHSESFGSLVAGFIIGAAFGAAVSLLYAPKPGREMREDISARLDEMKNTVDQTTRQVTETVKERLAEMKSDLAQAVDGARETAAEHASELSRRVELE